MRLINNDPIIQLRNIHLSQKNVRIGKEILCLLERLKVTLTEQKLNFLRRCKRRKSDVILLKSSLFNSASLFCRSDYNKIRQYQYNFIQKFANFKTLLQKDNKR